MKNTKDFQPKVAVIVLNYCNYQDTLSCINSLLKIDYSNYKIFIVDNDSPNESLDQLNSVIDYNVEVIESGMNGGFAYGNNVGIQKALEEGFEYILLLNNDTTIESDFLSKLIDTIQYQENVGIVTGKILYGSDKNRIWYAGGSVDWNNLRAIHYRINQLDEDNISTVQKVGFASGCCMLIPAKIIKEIGELPDDYFMYYEDLDYCVNIRNHGYNILYNPDSVIYHYVSSSSGGDNSPFVIEWNNRSRRLFCKKYKACIPVFKRPFVLLKCECRSLTKIVLSKDKIKGLKAYFRSFKKGMVGNSK